MFKFLRKFFSKEVKKENVTGLYIYESSQEETNNVVTDYKSKEKEKWEKQNELNRKIDACNLYLTHKSFDGSYEDYQTYLRQYMYSNSVNALQNMAYQQMQGGGNPYVSGRLNIGFFQ